jgi:hypothetical protein
VQHAGGIEKEHSRAGDPIFVLRFFVSIERDRRERKDQHARMRLDSRYKVQNKLSSHFSLGFSCVFGVARQANRVKHGSL